MLIETNSNLYVYVIARDFGFAPNPFFGVCTLATCKPDIRKGAKVGDWILGVAGAGLGNYIHRKCILLMKVTEKMTFQEYWDDERFKLKKPCRNGSKTKMLGDNIYHHDVNGQWIQEDSHHSNSDGTIHNGNLHRDTGRCDKVLISEFFLFFGNEAVDIDLESIDYISKPGCKKIELNDCIAGRKIIESVFSENKNNINCVLSDPCQFLESHKRVDQETSKFF